MNKKYRLYILGLLVLLICATGCDKEDYENYKKSIGNGVSCSYAPDGTANKLNSLVRFTIKATAQDVSINYITDSGSKDYKYIVFKFNGNNEISGIDFNKFHDLGGYTLNYTNFKYTDFFESYQNSGSCPDIYFPVSASTTQFEVSTKSIGTKYYHYMSSSSSRRNGSSSSSNSGNTSTNTGNSGNTSTNSGNSGNTSSNMGNSGNTSTNTGNSGNTSTNTGNSGNSSSNSGNNYTVSPHSVCSSSSYRRPVRFIGWILSIVRIIVPIIIIGFGVFDLYKGMASFDAEKNTKASLKNLVIRILAGVFIFLLPGIIEFILGMVSTWTSGSGNYNYSNAWACCSECVFDSSCNLDGSSSKYCK